MRTKIYLFIAIIIIALSGELYLKSLQLKAVKIEKEIYKSNNTTLLQDVEIYKAKNNLNAATVGELQMTLSEYKKYRADDLALIKTLQTKNRDLASVTTAQTQTITQLTGKVIDSIVYRDNYIIDTLKCIDISSEWFDLKGCSNRNNDFFGKFENRDSLLIAETIKYKRFLGFLWETEKIKDRKIDVVSKNPNTRILGVELVTIRDKL